MKFSPRFETGRTNVALILFMIAGFLGTSSAAFAQLKFEIGVSRDKAVRAMINNGYDQIKIVRKGLKTVRAEACLSGTKYLVRVDDKYRVSNQQQLGLCRSTVSSEALERNLINSGYERVVMERQNGRFIAIACRDGARVRITFSDQGEVIKRRQIGKCQEIFDPNDVRKVLRDAGFNRIRFVDRQLPWYRAEACQDSTRFELLLTRYGEIRKSTPIGECAPAMRPDQLEAFLSHKGYDRIEVIAERFPRFQATACLGNERFELELNRFGEITSRDIIGECRSEMDEQDIAKLLRSEGFKRISVVKNQSGGFDIASCLNGYQKFAVLSQFGELLSERDGQPCKPQRVSDILQTLKGRGFTQTKIYSESCRNGRLIQIQYNSDGDEIGRKRVGVC